MSADLTPPADAPLTPPEGLRMPLWADTEHGHIRDAARGSIAVGVSDSVALYLVAAANAAPDMATRLATPIACPRCDRDDLTVGDLPGHLPCLSRTETEERLGEVEAELAALRAQVARLRAALSDAVDLAAEGISYTEPYFRTKWEMVERLAAISAVAAEQGALDAAGEVERG